MSFSFQNQCVKENRPRPVNRLVAHSFRSRRFSDPAFSYLDEIEASPPVNILVEKADFKNKTCFIE